VTKGQQKMSTISDRLLKGLEVTGKDYRVRDKAGRGSGYHGFGVKVTAAGKRTFFLEYTFGGKRRFLNLGHYPAKKLKDAREEAKQARTLIDQGVDPKLERDRTAAREEAERQKIAEANHAVTVSEVLDFYTGKLRESTARDVERLFSNQYCNVRKAVGSKRVMDLTEENIEDLLECHLLRDRRRNAGKLYSYLASAFKQARRHKPFRLKGWINPFNDLEKPENSAGTPRERALSVGEIKTFLDLLDDTLRMSDGIKSVLKLILFTGQRVEQVSRMQWSHLDLEERLWRVPPEETKEGKKHSRKTHLVPLNEHAIALIESTPSVDGSDFLFPGKGADLPHDLGSFAQALGRLLKRHELEHFTPRDLRRTVTTHLARLGISKEIRNRIQDHLVGVDVDARHYDQYDYLAEKRMGLECWSSELNRILGGESQDNVVQIQQAVHG